MRRGGLVLFQQPWDPSPLITKSNRNASQRFADHAVRSSSVGETRTFSSLPLVSPVKCVDRDTHWSSSSNCYCVLAHADFSTGVRSLKLAGSKLPHQFSWSSKRGSQLKTRAVLMMASAVPEGYRPNVGLCLVNSKNEVFVASRLDLPDSWQMPQGGVDDGEEPRDAAIRELKEETGVTSVQVIGEVPEWLTYDFPPDVKVKITQLWGKEWTGQAQKWFLLRFTGNDDEIDLAGNGTERPEFGEWKWLPAKEVLTVAVDFKRPVYAQAFRSLSVYMECWAKLS